MNMLLESRLKERREQLQKMQERFNSINQARAQAEAAIIQLSGAVAELEGLVKELETPPTVTPAVLKEGLDAKTDDLGPTLVNQQKN